MNHLFHSPLLFRTAGSGGALWVQRDSPDSSSEPTLACGLGRNCAYVNRPHCVMDPLFCSASWVNKMCVGRCRLVLENIDPTQQIIWSLRQNTPPKKERKENVYYRNLNTNLILKIQPLGLNLWHENIGIVLTRTSHYNTAEINISRESRKTHFRFGGKYQPDSGKIEKRRSNELSWRYPPEGGKIQKGTTDEQICYKVWTGER